MWGNEQVSTYGKSVERQDQVLGKEPGLGKIKSSKSEGSNFRKSRANCRGVERQQKELEFMSVSLVLSIARSTSHIFVQYIIQVS